VAAPIIYIILTNQSNLKSINTHIDINGVYLLQTEDNLLHLLGASERRRGIAGYSYVYPQKRIVVGLADKSKKVVRISTTNPKDNVFDIHVGDSTEVIDSTLGKYNFKKEERGLYRSRNVSINIVGKDTIEEIIISYLDKGHRNIHY